MREEVTKNETLAALLRHRATKPPASMWNAEPLASINRVLLFDCREEATLLIIEAIAGQHGEVITTGSHTGEQVTICGCLIEAKGDDLQATAQKLRLSYALATTRYDTGLDTGI